MPVAIGGLVIQPGDLIVGDEDGLVAIPAEMAAGLLVKVHQLAQREEERKKAILSGTDKRGWIDAYLKENGVL